MIGRTKGDVNTRFHAATDATGRPISFLPSAGQESGDAGTAALLDERPRAEWRLADRGYHTDLHRDALQTKGITPCIPGRKSRNKSMK